MKEMMDLGWWIWVYKDPKWIYKNRSLDDVCMREAFGLAELDVILNLSLRFIVTLSSFGIHIIFTFLIFSLCGL